MAKLLEVNNLTVSFKTEDGSYKPAVKEVSFTINKGETVAIVGESGSGKSVSSMSILGLIPIPPGKIESGTALFQSDTYGETDLLKLSVKELQKVRGAEISMIFQEPMTALNPVIKCGKQLLENILVHSSITKKQAEVKAKDLLEEVDLTDTKRVMNSYPHELSGGQRQRVMIAMALAADPELLIADEPTTALDVTVQANIIQLLKELKEKRGMSILFISHDLGLVQQIAERTIVMYKGSIVEQGNTAELFKNAKHAYTRALVECRPSAELKGKLLPTISDLMEDRDGEIISKKYTPVNLAEHPISEEHILDGEHLKKTFTENKSLLGGKAGYFTAVDDISFYIREGETLGLVGESGCGKSTLGRMLIRLTHPTDGKILYRGEQLTGGKEIAKEIQLIFQDPYSSLNPKISVGDAIMEPMLVHHIGTNYADRKTRVIELLNKVGLLEEHFNRYPHEFSGGQRQRICIARALAVEPRFIICDESVSALDVSVQSQVLNLLKKLQVEMNLTYLFITHDLSVVHYIADRIMVMNKGKIEEIGEADEVFNHPQTAYTQKLIKAIPH